MSATTRPRPRPVPQTGPAVWSAADLTAADWMVPVGTEEAAELEAALTAAQAAAPVPPLTRLAPILADVTARLDTGRGFCLLRGLPFDRHGAAAAEAALVALGEHLGQPLVLGGAAVSRLTGPPPQDPGASGPPRFHIEACDAIALLCLANGPEAPAHVHGLGRRRAQRGDAPRPCRARRTLRTGAAARGRRRPSRAPSSP